MIPLFPRYSQMHYGHSFNKNPTSYNINRFTNKSFFGITSNSTAIDSPDYSSNSTTAHSPFFEIFGIRLYFDDILIICLLFFLYQENVDDQLLFIALLLLLLS